jgi:hypothetical protein
MLNLHEPDDQRSSRLSAIGYRLSPIGYSFSPTARAAERITAVLRNRTLHAATEMNFGLHSAGSGRLARYGRPGQGSTYPRSATNAQSPSARRHKGEYRFIFMSQQVLPLPKGVKKATASGALEAFSAPPAEDEAYRPGAAPARRSRQQTRKCCHRRRCW